jgi:hypothetical protein
MGLKNLRTISYIRGIWLVKFFIVLVPVVLVMIIINRRTLLFGNSTVTFRPGQTYNLISLGVGQMVKTADPYPYNWIVQNDALNIYTWLPRVIPKVKLELRLPPTNAEYIALTAKSPQGSVDQVQVVWSKMLNGLPWSRISSGGLSIWKNPAVKDKTSFTSIEDIPVDQKDIRHFGFVNLDPYIFDVPTDYKPSSEMFTAKTALRGSHMVYVYAANEDFEFAFSKVDRNFLKGEDEMRIRLLRADEPDQHQNLYDVKISDDGNITNNGMAGRAQNVSVRVPKVRPGMYRMQIDCSDDVVLTQIRSRQKYVGFSHSMQLADGPSYHAVFGETGYESAKISTNTSVIDSSIVHADAAQSLKVGNNIYVFTKTKEVKTMELSGERTTFTVSKPNLRLNIANGLITFSPFELPGVGGAVVALYPPTPLRDITYLFAEYLPKTNTEDIIVRQEYAQSGLGINGQRQLSFTLDIPGLRQNGYHVGVKKISISYLPGPLDWQKVLRRLKGVF